MGVGAQREGCGIGRQEDGMSNRTHMYIYTHTYIHTLIATMPDDIRLEALKAIRDSLQTDLG